MPIKGNWLGEKNWDTDYKWEDKRITDSKEMCHFIWTNVQITPLRTNSILPVIVSRASLLYIYEINPSFINYKNICIYIYKNNPLL